MLVSAYTMSAGGSIAMYTHNMSSWVRLEYMKISTEAFYVSYGCWTPHIPRMLVGCSRWFRRNRKCKVLNKWERKRQAMGNTWVFPMF